MMQEFKMGNRLEDGKKNVMKNGGYS